MASNTSSWLSSDVCQLLDVFLAAAADVGRPYAIGGALAMGAHGYRRHTNDVDVFVNHKDRGEWIRALRARGLTVVPLFAGVHYAAYLPDNKDPEVRLDLLVPAEDPDLSAIEVPDTATIANRTVDVWPIDLLVVAKFRSTRKEDRADVGKMFERGLFDPKSVRSIMRTIGETDVAKRFWKKYGGE